MDIFLSKKFEYGISFYQLHKGLTYDAKSKVSPFTLPVLMSL